MPRKKPKLDYAILSDDIREEIGNKLTLVGIYEDKIIVSGLPHIFPKLCVFAQMTGISQNDRFTVQLEDPDGKKLGKNLTFAIPHKERIQKLRIIGIFSPLKVDKEGTYTFTVTVNDNQVNKEKLSFEITLQQKTIQPEGPAAN